VIIQARFFVESVKRTGHPDGKGGVLGVCEIVTLRAIYSSGPDDPNRSFAEATPQAYMEMTITNREVFGAFEPGKLYDLLFTPKE